MRIKIEPIDQADRNKGFKIYVNHWNTGATYRDYDAACQVANAISDGALLREDTMIVIDYSACL